MPHGRHLILVLLVGLAACRSPDRARPAGTRAPAPEPTKATGRHDRIVAFVGAKVALDPDPGTAPFRIEPAPPPGLAFDPATGDLAGTPTAATPGGLYRIIDAAHRERVVHLEIVAAPTAADRFVAVGGDDAGPGTEARPFGTIEHALAGARPGTRVFLRGGRYREEVLIRKLRGDDTAPIVVRAVPGEAAQIEPPSPAITWTRATDPDAAPDEWISNEAFAWSKHESLSRGAFAAREPFTRLLTYSQLADLRAGNQRWTRDGSLPGATTPSGNPKPWTYFGPGVWHDPDTGRVHLRLSPTTNGVPGLADYAGPTDPAQVEVALWPRTSTALRVEKSANLELRDLVLVGGGDRTASVEGSTNVTFDHVEIRAGTMGLTVGHSTGVRFLHGRLDGGVPPWSFRSDYKDNYKVADPDGEVLDENNLVRKTSRALLYIAGGVRDLEIGYSELENAHDIYLAGIHAELHHCLIRNIHDDGLFISHVKDIDDLRIHDNVMERVLTGISGEGRRASGSRLVYRNIFDLREPTAGYRPGGPNPSTWRWGHLFKGPLSVAPFYFYQNTVLLRPDKRGQPALHLFNQLEKTGTAVQPRWFVNNLVVVGNNVGPLTFVPDESYLAAKDADGRPLLYSDGNAWVRLPIATPPVPGVGGGKRKHQGPGGAPLFRCASAHKGGASCPAKAWDTIDAVRVTGFERRSRIAATPGFAKMASIEAAAPDDDLRPAPGSPALGTAVELPATLPDSAVVTSADAGALPANAPPLRVGVDGAHAY